MQIILNKEGLRQLQQWLNRPCPTCKQPTTGKPPKWRHLLTEETNYNTCIECGNNVPKNEQSLAYKVRWVRARRRLVMNQ